MLFFQIIAKHETPRPQYVPDFLLAYLTIFQSWCFVGTRSEFSLFFFPFITKFIQWQEYRQYWHRGEILNNWKFSSPPKPRDHWPGEILLIYALIQFVNGQLSPIYLMQKPFGGQESFGFKGWIMYKITYCVIFQLLSRQGLNSRPLSYRCFWYHINEQLSQKLMNDFISNRIKA